MTTYAYIYDTTRFQIVKTRGGRYIPQHKSPFAKDFASFKERGITVSRCRQADAIKYIQRRAKVENPEISFVDQSQLDQHLQQLKDQLIKKMDKSYWVALSQTELASFQEEVSNAYDWLFTNDVPPVHIERVQVEVGFY